MKTITLRQWIFNKNETLISVVDKIRTEGNNDLKLTLPCITGSGVIIGNRTDQNLKNHSDLYINLNYNSVAEYQQNLNLIEGWVSFNYPV